MKCAEQANTYKQEPRGEKIGVNAARVSCSGYENVLKLDSSDGYIIL